MSFGFTHSWLREDEELDRYNKPGSPDWFDLSDEVSFDKPNNRHDALKVESLLGYGGYLDLDKVGEAMGLGPRRLEEPVKAFQEKNGLKVDGLLKPGGPTITKMKQLYGKAFAGSPAPTPAMMDVQAEQIDEGKDGFIYGAAPKPLPKPNKRLDAKIELFDYERWNSDWARNATDPASYAPEYESYIRQIEPTHGHDPGLIYARDFAQKVEKRRGKGGEFVQSLLARLADRPDLQRAFLGGEVPHHPPQGTFRPGGEADVKNWIDQDRIANGIAPKFSKAAQASAPVLRTSSGVASAPQATEPDPKNLLEYGPNFGLPEDQALAQQPPHAPDLPNPRPVEPRAAEQAPPALAPREPASGEGGADWYDPNEMSMAGANRRPPSGKSDGQGGAGWYDPNQMNPEGSHRRPKPDNSRGFEDEFPPPSPPERPKPPRDYSQIDDDALQTELEAQPGIRERAEQNGDLASRRLETHEARKVEQLEALKEKYGADAAEALWDELADMLKKGELDEWNRWRGAAGKAAYALGKIGRGLGKAAVEARPDILETYQVLRDVVNAQEQVRQARRETIDSRETEDAIRKEIERRRGSSGRPDPSPRD